MKRLDKIRTLANIDKAISAYEDGLDGLPKPIAARRIELTFCKHYFVQHTPSPCGLCPMFQPGYQDHRHTTCLDQKTRSAAITSSEEYHKHPDPDWFKAMIKSTRKRIAYLKALRTRWSKD